MSLNASVGEMSQECVCTMDMKATESIVAAVKPVVWTLTEQTVLSLPAERHTREYSVG